MWQLRTAVQSDPWNCHLRTVSGIIIKEGGDRVDEIGG